MKSDTKYKLEVVVTNGNQLESIYQLEKEIKTKWIEVTIPEVQRETVPSLVNQYSRKQINTISFAQNEEFENYIKSTRNAKVSGNLLGKCGNGTEPTGCTDEVGQNIEAGYWYKVESTIQLTYDALSNAIDTLYAIVYDATEKDIKTSITDTIFKIDTVSPSKPTIDNPTKGEWTKESFSLIVSSRDLESGMGYYQYSYDNSNWVTYHDSAKETFTTTPFNIERNQLAYIRACDVLDNCSESASTMIKIDKTGPGLVLEDATTTSNSANINIKALMDSGVGEPRIKSCEYGKTTTYGSNGIIEGNTSCKLNNLEANATYYYQICGEDKLGNTTCKKDSTASQNIIAPSIDFSSNPSSPVSGYVKEQTVRVILPSGSKVGYYVKTTLAGRTSTGVTQSCGTSTNPGNCSTITETTSLNPNVWYKITENINITYNNDTNTNGYVYATAYDGVNVVFAQTRTLAKIDKMAPSKPTIDNPTKGEWTKENFSLIVSSRDLGSGMGYYQYSYDNSNWVTYRDSAKETFTTTPFSAERNQLAYIRACDALDNCSESASTMIKIDKTVPAIPSVTYNNGYNIAAKQNYYKITLQSNAASEIKHYEIDTNGDGVADHTTTSSFEPWNGYSSSISRFRAVSYVGLKSSWTGNYAIHRDTSVKDNPLSNGMYIIESASNRNYVMDVDGGTFKNGTNIQVYSKNWTISQQFYLEYLNNGYYKIVNDANRGYGLDVTGVVFAQGTNMQLYSYNGNIAQQFKILKGIDAGYFIVSHDGGLVLDAYSVSNGGNVYLYPPHGGDNQRWSFRQYDDTQCSIYGPGTSDITITANSIYLNSAGMEESGCESGIKTKTCKYGTSSGNYTKNGTLSGMSCTMSNLNPNTRYYYQYCITTNLGKTTCFTGNALTKNGSVSTASTAY